MPHDKQCVCRHDTDHYEEFESDCRRCFIPEQWLLEYPSLDTPGREWTFALMGHCRYCRRELRYAFPLRPYENWPGMLGQVYSHIVRARPFDWIDLETSTYRDHVIDRARWYRQQDDLTQEQRHELFLGLFRDGDRRKVRRWLEREHTAEAFTRPKRDRKSVFFSAVLDRARAAGCLSDIEPILDYCLPNTQEPESPETDQYLTDYRFNIDPHIQFGCEGIFVDLCLEGSFDATDRTKLHVGTFKTLRQDQEACELMGKLCGLLMFHGSAYVNENIHRYTPVQELEQMRLQEQSEERKE